METEQSGAAEAIKEVERLTRAAAGPHTITIEAPDGTGGVKPISVLVHDGRPLVLVDAARTAAQLARELRATEKAPPGWRSGTALHQSLTSFITHINRFKASEQSAVWADPARRRLVAVLDYHPAGADSPAAWGRHKGAYECPLSAAWNAWGGEKGLSLSQEEFAELIDTRDYELASGKFPGKGIEAPTPAALVTLANNLEVYSTATAKRERDVNTGRIKLSYSEDKGVSGTVMPPSAFLISIQVFQDSKPRPLEVRLRVTVEDNQAKFNLGIHGATDVLRVAFDEVCADVEQGTGVPVFRGTPEQAA